MSGSLEQDQLSSFRARVDFDSDSTRAIAEEKEGPTYRYGSPAKHDGAYLSLKNSTHYQLNLELAIRQMNLKLARYPAVISIQVRI